MDVLAWPSIPLKEVPRDLEPRSWRNAKFTKAPHPKYLT